MTSTSRLDHTLWSIAAVIASVAALVFALRGGVAHADSASGGRIGRYQMIAERVDGYDIIDTMNGHVYELDSSTGYRWAPLAQQFDAAAMAAAPPSATTPRP